MNRLTVDRAVLPPLLLPLAKAQQRVEHTRDDALIERQLADAINAVERRCNININPAQFALRPCDWAYRWCACSTPPGTAVGPLPVNNVKAIVGMLVGGVDVKADYAIEQAQFGGNAEAFLVGPVLYSNEPLLTVDVGMATVDELEPAVLAAVLRIAAAYYENRESFAPIVVDDFAGELVSVWRPAV